MNLALIQSIYQGALIMLRITGLFLTAPFFGSKVIPKRIKAGLVFLLTLVLKSVVDSNNLELPANILMLLFNFLSELTIGLIFGFITILIFASIQLAGQMISMRMGLAMANIMDPTNGSSIAVIGQFKNVLATLFFLVINGHHHLLRALKHSFDVIPLTGLSLSDALFMKLLRMAGDLFPLAFQIALPIIAVLFLTDVAFGLVARTVPQMNVFVMGLPTKLLVGTFLLFITIPVYISLLRGLFNDLFISLDKIISILGN
ncbi:flagellar biosynthetic protein FliR [Sporohalobacter salinus]|uniref:flagellar biosynthetic protein FliR n=1 Tax=Sporohalobacter salinus TaxID=1494606 RepID=UPI00195FE809|nr:flagellar biosynthetic protein FliR [Sporohalobacter salinus]MBM7623506.1 flagellar biosynthetic protein FliR [Sporohalobacter salinus]